MRNGGMRPDFACFKMVNFETVNTSASSLALFYLVCRDTGSVLLFLELRESVRVLTRLDSRWHPWLPKQLDCQKTHGRSPGSNAAKSR
jgi:hypothetical protein